jgi:hypothetical protein
MSSDYSTQTSRRSSRGGRSRSRRRSGGGERSSSENTSTRGATSPSPSTNGSRRRKRKLTLWEKVVAFFTGGAAEPKHSTPVSVHKAAEARPEDSRSSEARQSRTDRPQRSGMRTPELVEVTTPRLYVGNLSFDATESDMLDLFSGVGLVQSVEVVSNRQTHRSKGFAFVQMQTIEEARRAVAELHDKEYMGRKLVVSGAKAADRKPERPSHSPDEATPAVQPEQ